MKILFEDEDLIVCIKPVGVLSQGGGEASLETALREHTGGEIFPVHRLDAGVGGVMVYAKTKSAAAKLSAQVAERRFEKEYLALLCGRPESESGRLEDLLFKDSSKNKVFVVKRERRGVKKAVCEYRSLWSGRLKNEEYTLVLVKLKTGRTHQIRVQFASRKLPLSGDKKYGARDGEKQIGLFSCKLSFDSPRTGESTSFSSLETESELLKSAIEKAEISTDEHGLSAEPK